MVIADNGDFVTAYDGINILLEHSTDTITVAIASIAYTIAISGGDLCFHVRDEANIMTVDNISYEDPICLEAGDSITFRSDITSPFNNRLLITITYTGVQLFTINLDYFYCEIQRFTPLPDYWQWLLSLSGNLNRPYPRPWSDYNTDYSTWVALVNFGFDSFIDFRDLPDEPAVEKYV